MAITTNKRFDRRAIESSYFYNLLGEGVQNVEGLVQIANSDGEVIDPATGAAAATGGGSSTYSTAQGDFTATPTVGTTNITITGLPFTLEDQHVVNGSIKKISSAGVVSTVDSGNISVSGGVITLSEADNFVSGDSVVVSITGEDKAYSRELDATITTVLNPNYAHYTSVEHLVDLSAQAAITNRYVIPMEGYNFITMHWRLVTTNAGDTTTITVWATLDADANDSADTSWVDISSSFLGGVSKSANNSTEEDVAIQDTASPWLKWMVKVVTTTGGTNTNAIDVFIKKSS